LVKKAHLLKQALKDIFVLKIILFLRIKSNKNISLFYFSKKTEKQGKITQIKIGTELRLFSKFRNKKAT
jgi:hypothetical protein